MENQREKRRRLKREAKEKMRQSNTSPYLSAVIYGAIMIAVVAIAIIFVITSLIAALAVTGFNGEELSQAFLNGADIWTYVIECVIGIFSTLMGIGFMRYTLKVFRGQESRYSDVFSGFSKKGVKALIANIIIGIVTGVIVVIAAIVVSVILIGIAAVIGNEVISTILIAAIAILICALALMFYYSFLFTVYIICDEDDIGVVKAAFKSRKMVKGHKWQLFKVDLSFIGWYILTTVTLCLAGIYVVPYAYTVQAGYYDEIKKEYESTAE